VASWGARTPALLLTQVRFCAPLSRTAAIRFSGMPQRPKPPTSSVAPSWMSATASAAVSQNCSGWYLWAVAVLPNARAQSRYTPPDKRSSGCDSAAMAAGRVEEGVVTWVPAASGWVASK